MVNHMVTILKDDMNDSWMLYEYLEHAIAKDDDTVKQFFHSRLKTRISNLKDDVKKLREVAGKSKDVAWNDIGDSLLMVFEESANNLEYKMNKLTNNM